MGGGGPWLPVLVAGEFAAPRPGYDARLWSTVFPVGMDVACSFGAGGVAGIDEIVDFARLRTWVAVAIWLAFFSALLRRGAALWRASG